MTAAGRADASQIAVSTSTGRSESLIGKMENCRIRRADARPTDIVRSAGACVARLASYSAGAMKLAVNPTHPEPRKIARAVEVMRAGGVIVYPTDTVYGLGCDITDKHAVERIHEMKKMRKDQLMTFVCPEVADVARYGIVDDSAYRILRRLVPGPYTFILRATREVPKVLRLERKTVGIRVPDQPVALALARELGGPVASTSASLAGEILFDPDEIEERFPQVDLILDVGAGGMTPSTVIDLSGDAPVVLREGAGPVDFV